MKYFIIKFSKYLLVVITIYALLFKVSNYLLKTKYSNIFSGFVIDKYKNITDKNIENRLIIMGGSNTIFSIDSQLLEKELKIKVINSGFVFNTGYQFQLNFLKNHARKGDFIIYIPEFNYYSGKGQFGANFINNAFLTEPKLISSLGSVNTLNFFRSGFKSMLNPVFSFIKDESIPSEIKRRDFNKYGDLTYHLDKKNKLEKVRSYPIIEKVKISTAFIDNINSLDLILKKKEIRFYITFPVYSKKFITKNAISTLDSLTNTNSKFIGHIKENIFEDTMFFDSPYHALKKTREIYTRNLIKTLKNVI
ncbi:hypothetical protein H9I45_03435 [Polaribacter haliotis]|uniref:Uncharacterized protein n=1 Tax=Polaribacter haliotis TaxID=1888915 RepID=A0A7L8AHP9_9FLAO|nr:hypothetical protein [Polaribacter haliotis]QOD61516.1 hypothetical protein H9I45_03435 [Polaribacter haliotis]